MTTVVSSAVFSGPVGLVGQDHSLVIGLIGAICRELHYVWRDQDGNLAFFHVVVLKCNMINIWISL